MAAAAEDAARRQLSPAGRASRGALLYTPFYGLDYYGSIFPMSGGIFSPRATELPSFRRGAMPNNVPAYFSDWPAAIVSMLICSG